jgi:hypothetical protein
MNMNSNAPQPTQVLRLVQLGTSDWGILSAGLSASIDTVNNQVVIHVCLVGGLGTNLVGQFQPMQVSLREVGRMSVDEVVKLFEANLEAKKLQEASMIVPANV